MTRSDHESVIGIEVSAPARLHFGLFSIGDLTQRKFGGAGLMIDSPRTIVSLVPSSSLEIFGLERPLVRQAVERWFAFHRRDVAKLGSIQSVDALPVRVEVSQIAMRHAGFGSGTQIALSIALGLCKIHQIPTPSVEELAAMTGRGKRSAIGSHGFLRGGFLVDRGKAGDESLSPLDLRIEFPESWRMVTIHQPNEISVFGEFEKKAFRELPPTTPQARQQMVTLVKQTLVPALLSSDFDMFSNGLFEFGRASGMMYAPIQDGPYNGRAIDELVKEVSDNEVVGVGQSSWGPCVYAVCKNQSQAEQLVGNLNEWFEQRDLEAIIDIAKADNRGVSIEVISDN